MAPKNKSWDEKFVRACQNDVPKVVKIEGKLSRRWGTGTCVIPSPLEVDELMRKVPKGKLTTINDMRSLLARRHQATMACPITTGIFSWLAAHRAEEARARGKSGITPYWRTLKSGGEVNPKYPGGLPAQRMFLEAEGHRLVQKGKKAKVVDYEKRLVKLPTRKQR